MRTIAETEVANGLLPVFEAAQLEPVVIRRQDHDVAVVLSMTEYGRLRGVDHLASLAEHDRWEAEAAAVDQISDARLAALLSDEDV